MFLTNGLSNPLSTLNPSVMLVPKKQFHFYWALILKNSTNAVRYLMAFGDEKTANCHNTAVYPQKTIQIKY
ncbi:hypothetical protein ACRQ5D_17840 [Mucilaginibacter sp. P25]|uniref:hypothetical protein n=1 Tax=Mucilaginibacter sp. P25 TaxID=3423945 RepID=UPI003D7AF329